MTTLETNDKIKNQNIDDRYHLKGTSIKNFKKYCNEFVEEGLFKKLAIEVGLSKTENILPSTWYSAVRFKLLMEIVAQELRIDLIELTNSFSPYMIEQDLNGVYKWLFKILKPRTALGKVVSLDNAYNDYCELSVIDNVKGNFKGKACIPTELSDWHLAFVKAGMSKILELCGAEVNSFSILPENDAMDDLITSHLQIHYT